MFANDALGRTVLVDDPEESLFQRSAGTGATTSQASTGALATPAQRQPYNGLNPDDILNAAVLQRSQGADNETLLSRAVSSGLTEAEARSILNRMPAPTASTSGTSTSTSTGALASGATSTATSRSTGALATAAQTPSTASSLRSQYDAIANDFSSTASQKLAAFNKLLSDNKLTSLSFARASGISANNVRNLWPSDAQSSTWSLPNELAKETGVATDKYGEIAAGIGSGYLPADQARQLANMLVTEMNKYGHSYADVAKLLGNDPSYANTLRTFISNNYVDPTKVADRNPLNLTAQELLDVQSGKRDINDIEAERAAANVASTASSTAATSDTKIPTLTDYQGKTYGGDVIARLARQISQNLDTSNLRGSAFGVTVGEDTSIGFSASEAKKLLGRMPTAPEMVILDMARGLASQGITDISDLGKYKPTEVEETVEGEGSPITQTVTKLINPETGKEFTPGFGATYTGEGGTGYHVEFDSEGKPKFYTSGISTSDAGKIMPLLTLATLPFGGVGGLLSGVTGTAGIGGLAGAALGELGMQTAGSGLAGALASAGLSETLANIGANALVSGGFQGALSELAGGNFAEGFKSGALGGLASGLGSQVSSMLPKELAAVGSNAITQLITTGKLDPAALATSVGTSLATDALAAETGLDKATAGKLVTAGLQALQGNELAALTSLTQAGLQSGQSTVTGASGTDTTSGAAGRDVVDEYNVTGGGGALISSGNPTEDQLIDFERRTNAANQLLTDYKASGSDISRDDAISRLTSLGVSATRAQELITNADAEVETRRVTSGIVADYTARDSDLSRDAAYGRLIEAGNTPTKANEILASVDAQVEANRAARAATATQNQAAVAAGAGEFAGADERAAIAAGAGEFTGADKSAAINARIQNAASFNDAYAIARQEFGPNATFNYGGKLYSTATAAERPDLSGTTSKPSTEVPYVAPNGMHNRAAFIQAGGGTSDADYAKYVQAVNAVIAEGKSGTLITPASVNSTGKEMPSTTGPVTMEKPRVDSVLGSVVAQGVASFGANSIAGALSALGFTDAGRTVLDKANQIAAAATAAEGADITQGKKDIDAAIQKVGGSSGIRDFATNVGNLVSTAFNNPKAFGATVGSEVVEEVLQLATLKFPGSFLVKETVASALENGGAAYNTEYESQIAKGASKEDAHLAAQKAAGTAAGVTVALAGGAAGLGKVAGKVFGSQADEAASGVSQVGKTTLKNSAQEVLEEGSIAGSIDLALGRPIDAVNALTNMTGGALYGGVTAGSMQGTKLDTLDQAASTSIGSGVQASFNNTLSQTGDIVQASTGSVTTAINNGLNPGAAVSTVISTAAQSGVDMSTAITSSVDAGLSTALSSGAGTSATVSTIVAGSVTASLNNGVNVTTAIDSTVGSSVKTGIATGADASTVVTSSVSSAVSTALNNGASASTVVTGAVNSAVTSGLAAGANASTVIASSVTAAVSTATQNGANSTAVVTGSTSTAVSTAIASGVDASTAVGSAVTAATNAGANASVAAASSITAAIAAGTDTNTAIAAATGANSNVTANSTTQNNVTTTTATDTNTGVTTQTSVNTNTNTTTTVTTSNNVTTQVTTAGSTTTTVTSDVNTGLTTQTTVDGTRSTDVTVDTNTNVTTQVVTDTNTNTKVTVTWSPDGTTKVTYTDPEGQETVFDDIDVGDPPKIDIVAPLEPVKPAEPTPKTPQPKVSQPSSTSSAVIPSAGVVAAGVDWLGPQFLKSKERGTYVDPLAEFQALQQQADQQQILSQIQPELASVLTERGAMPYYTYGQEPSIDEVLGLPDQESSSYNESDYVPVFKSGGKVSPLNIQMMYAKGGHAREDFRDGKHVAGPGDGQSDDIPAWLADGEFVFPADVVSALGNGSTKAGTEKLYEMMHEIRGRARSKHPKDLPPPAHKSPLDYLKKGK